MILLMIGGHLSVSTSSNNLYQDIVGLFNSLGIHVGVTRLLENPHYNTAYQIKPVTVEGYEKCKKNPLLCLTNLEQGD